MSRYYNTRCTREIETLDLLSRTRELTLEESLRLETAIVQQENNERRRRKRIGTIEHFLHSREPQFPLCEERVFSEFPHNPIGDEAQSGA